MRDLLGEVLRALVALKAGVPVVQVDRLPPAPHLTVRPFPRPATALEAARDRAAREAAQVILRLFFPHHDE